MLVFRPVREADLDGIYQLAKQAGIGVTTLPAEKETLHAKIDLSLKTFAQKTRSQKDQVYFFVLEDLTHHKIVGTSAIDACAGGELPFYSYKLVNLMQVSHSLELQFNHPVLHLSNDYQSKTEICTLFLAPDYRKHGNGLLLSRGRFLFMAQFPQFFSDLVFAEMRGVSNLQGQSPFWQSLGQHFFGMTFADADRLTAVTNKQFIADLMPHHPIYVELLSVAAQRVIGKPHQDTKPALSMLEREGFVNKGYVDIFDAGPTIESSLSQIRTVRESEILRVNELSSDNHLSERYLMCNMKKDFRVVIASLQKNHLRQVTIHADIAKALELKVGDEIRVSLL